MGATAKYRHRATNETVLVPLPLNESMIEYTDSKDAKHQLARQTFDAQFYSVEPFRPRTDGLPSSRISSGEGPVAVEIPDAPAWFLEFAGSVHARLDKLEGPSGEVLEGIETRQKTIEGKLDQILAGLTPSK